MPESRQLEDLRGVERTVEIHFAAWAHLDFAQRIHYERGDVLPCDIAGLVPGQMRGKILLPAAYRSRWQVHFRQYDHVVELMLFRQSCQVRCRHVHGADITKVEARMKFEHDPEVEAAHVSEHAGTRHGFDCWLEGLAQHAQ